MYEILKILFREIVRRQEDVKEVKTVPDLCRVSWNPSKVAEVFAALNDGAEMDTKEILAIANDAYQEVCANA